jgi:hypothetical protein
LAAVLFSFCCERFQEKRSANEAKRNISKDAEKYLYHPVSSSNHDMLLHILLIPHSDRVSFFLPEMGLYQLKSAGVLFPRSSAG